MTAEVHLSDFDATIHNYILLDLDVRAHSLLDANIKVVSITMVLTYTSYQNLYYKLHF